MTNNKSPIIVALDKPDLTAALAIADQLDPKLCRLKVGKELFTACGKAAIDALHLRGFEIFLDLKFHDIPNTTAQAVKQAAELGVWLTNVHASIGAEALALCQKTLSGYNTKLIAVTVLTSMNAADLRALGIARTVPEQVLHLSKLAHAAGLYGVVCSAFEAAAVKEKCGSAFKTVTPAIRMADDQNHDQKRVMTPRTASENGADFLVMGRAITQSDVPNEKLKAVLASLAN